jgi:DNA-binding MurR/RpiR family transcriptional regulator
VPRTSSPLGDIDAAVAAHYQRLSPGQRRAIDRLLADTRYGAVVSPTELARAVGIHPSAVTRAAQVLGFEGFPDLQARLRAALLHVVPDEHAEAAGDTPAAAAIQVMLEDAESLQRTVAAFSPDILDGVVNRLVAARRVYIYGSRGAHGLALIAGLGLRLLLPDTRVLRDDFSDLSDLAEQAVGLDSSDALLAIGFQKVDPVIQQLVDWAAGLGAATIGITDHRSSPIARATTHTLFVHRGSEHQIPSYPAAGASLINALATAVAVRTRGAAQGRRLEAEHLSARLRARGEAWPGQTSLRVELTQQGEHQ